MITRHLRRRRRPSQPHNHDNNWAIELDHDNLRDYKQRYSHNDLTLPTLDHPQPRTPAITSRRH
eukprot:11989747-Prorocentrum_lima.AAC.1